jgi:hypothetical protein
MSSPTPADLLGCRRVVVADEDPKVVEFIIQTLRADGHVAFHAYDALAATELVFAVTSATSSSPIPRWAEFRVWS